MTIARTILVTGGVAAALAMAGCQMTPREAPRTGPVASGPTGNIEGSWIDEAGTGLTTFSNGRFQTIATDSGERLSEGTYTFRDMNFVEINGQSIIRQSAVSFNCAVATTDQLNCTSAAGQQFILRRQGGAVG